MLGPLASIGLLAKKILRSSAPSPHQQCTQILSLSFLLSLQYHEGFVIINVALVLLAFCKQWYPIVL
jgi:hypothetical protein